MIQKVDLKVIRTESVKDKNQIVYQSMLIDNFKSKMKNMTLEELKKYIQNSDQLQDQMEDQNVTRLLS